MQNPILQLAEQHRSFLNKRGVTNQVIDAFSIYTADVAALNLNNAIVIPVKHPDGTLSFNKYRRDPMEVDVKPKYLYEKGGKVTLYGADRLIKENNAHAMMYSLEHGVNHQRVKDKPPVTPVIITEGELDALVCWSHNIPAVTSTGGAMSFQEEWVESLKRYDVYLCFDNDEAGYKGMLKVLDYLPEAKVVIIPHNLGCKDISDFVGRGGDLHALLKNAYTITDIEDARATAEKLGGQWRVQEAKFFEMYIEKNKVSNIPTSTTGGINLDPKVVGRMAAAKSVHCESLLPFKRVGRFMKTECLWHKDSDPSLTLYPEKNNCYCFVCGKYADPIDIVQQRDGVSFKKAISNLLNE
jgi:hypothetical protein